ncbi:MAG TPA: hypothetical protein VJ697_04015 [Nitrososphaeraceae archaeon]|nr:hypothetical protein [Nitrososphaeraceae archaeon]
MIKRKKLQDDIEGNEDHEDILLKTVFLFDNKTTTILLTAI